MPSADRGLLTGITVADFSRVLAGPLCTMVLADLGADVIKIERPQGGDDTRSWGPPFVRGGDAAYFIALNRNKRSIALDLAHPADREIAHAIVRGADVVVENFRPGVMAGFGLDYGSLAPGHPTLVYCSIPAFAFSTNAATPGYDLLMQALTGFMSFTGEPGGEPVKMGVAMLDVVAGLFATIGVLGALRELDLSGQGQNVRVGLFESSVAALMNQAANFLLGGLVPEPAGNAHPNIVPYQAFRARDGQFVLAAGNDKLFRAACEAIGRPDLAGHPDYESNEKRVANRGRLTAGLQSMFDTDDVEEWVARFQKAGVPAAPVLAVDQVFEMEEAQRMLTTVLDPVRGPLPLVHSPLDLSGLQPMAMRAPPRLDEHRNEILKWIAGLSVPAS